MKGLVYIICALLAVALVVGCSGSGETPQAVDSATVDTSHVESVMDSASADSLAMLLGTLVGNDVARMRSNSGGPLSAFDADDYMKGVNVTLGHGRQSSSYTQGVRAARDIIAKIEDFRNYGVEINVDMLLHAIEEQLMADSITDVDILRFNSEYNELLQRSYASGQR